VLHLELPDVALLGLADVADAYDRVRKVMRPSGLRTEIYSGNQSSGWSVAHIDL
jgi:hypothetical protein